MSGDSLLFRRTSDSLEQVALDQIAGRLVEALGDEHRVFPDNDFDSSLLGLPGMSAGGLEGDPRLLTIGAGFVYVLIARFERSRIGGRELSCSLRTRPARNVQQSQWSSRVALGTRGVVIAAAPLGIKLAGNFLPRILVEEYGDIKFSHGADIEAVVAGEVFPEIHDGHRWNLFAGKVRLRFHDLARAVGRIQKYAGVRLLPVTRVQQRRFEIQPVAIGKGQRVFQKNGR